MVIYYTTEKAGSGEVLRRVLNGQGIAAEILFTENGKPYLERGECEFSLTDTDGLTAVAVGTQRVGLDAERRRPRKTDALLSRLTPAEKEEDFFELWTAKEAYVKYLGGTLARLLPALVYEKGVLFFKGAPQKVFLKHIRMGDHILCLCTEREEEVSLVKI